MYIRVEKRIPPSTTPLDSAAEQALLWFDLDKLMTDSQVRSVGFAPEVITGINTWVRASLEQYPVTETGGFLLGRYRTLEDGRFDVGILQFCPATRVAFRSPNRLAFGTGALIELDDALHARPDLLLCGWFHTHPGLTPYLSQMDLCIHEGFFRNPWHLAVVLDPMTDGWDTGFFSRQHNGKVNNKTEHIGQWTSWNAAGQDHPIVSSL